MREIADVVADLQAAAKRRAAIVAYWKRHNTAATRERFKISRQRLHQVLVREGVRQNGKAKP